MTTKATQAIKHLHRARELSSRIKSSPMTKAKEAEIIAKIRKDREIIWREKLANRT